MKEKDYLVHLESMGTTFIKLGQFLATRPDIIGEELSKKLRKSYKINYHHFQLFKQKK